MIKIKKYRTDLSTAMDLTNSIVGFLREEVGTFAVVSDFGSPDVEGSPVATYTAPGSSVEVEFVLAAPTEGDMNSAANLCADSAVEIEPTEEDIEKGRAFLAKELVKTISCNQNVYDMVVDAILSRFPEARKAPSIEEALAYAYDQCCEEDAAYTESLKST